jgi:DMSO/TMAO reductase YedYZ molybdopterin-dependent catalytic subunit
MSLSGAPSAWLARIPNVLAGLIAGLFAAVVMTLAMAASRYWLGIMPPPEAVPDRIAPLLSIDTFFELFGKYGGYDGLKKFGIVSGLRGIAATGALVGLIYAIVIESGWSRRSPRRIVGLSGTAFGFMLGAVLVAWIGLVAFLWPVLPANYRGVPFTWARILSIAALFTWIVIFAATLAGIYRWITRRLADTQSDSETAVQQPVARVMPRRAVVAVAAGAALTWPIYRTLRSMYYDATFFYDGRQYQGSDIQPIAPNERFYSVTKNVVDPDVNRDLWRLEIGGHVRDAKSFSYDDLLSMEQLDQETTLCCISNRIGAGLISNANWKGVRLRDLLDSAGVKDGAFEVFVSGADAYHDSFPIEKALEETTLVVYQMNGEPLPRIHGYPVRLIVPGMYGEKNVKWVSRVSVETTDKEGFYEQQGWGPTFIPPTRSDIFTPSYTNRPGVGYFFRNSFAIGQTVEIKGRAFAGDRGIRSVEYSVDSQATWAPAEIYYPGTDLTWALWRFEWTPDSPGEHVILTRAVDGTGAPQPGEPRSYIPDGAGGYHIVRATVE